MRPVSYTHLDVYKRQLLTVAALVAGPGGTAYAAPPVNGTTVVTGTPTAGVPLAVQVTLYGVYPIVPYDFSLENRCWFGGRFAGPADSYETYPLLGLSLIHI